MKWRAFMVFVEVQMSPPGGTITPKYLGELEADTKGDALEAARVVWPIPASCTISKSFTAGHHVEDAAEMDARLGRS